MRVLWSVNTLIPNIAKEMGLKPGHAISWVDAMKESIISQISNISLAIVCHGGHRVKHITKYSSGGVKYYILPHNCERKDYWCEIIREFNPDIIHIYGTERKHNLKLIEKYRNQIPIIISIQGIITEYYKRYYADLRFFEILRNYSIRDIIFRNGIINGKRKFKKQAKIEKKMFEMVKYVEGRSDWDRAMVQNINSNVMYYYCPRMIRTPFYKYRWSMNDAEKNSLIVSQGNYPIKGLHILLDALRIVKLKFPDVKLYIAGNDIYKKHGIIKDSGYNRLIKRRINKYGLNNNIYYTGFLDAQKMAEYLCKVNVCVIPSAIENAPNALAEAMLVGTPIVSSYVGGSPDMLNHGECGQLYCYYEAEMLADRIVNYFNDSALCEKHSIIENRIANDRHNQYRLPQQLVNIYQSVIEDNKANGGII